MWKNDEWTAGFFFSFFFFFSLMNLCKELQNKTVNTEKKVKFSSLLGNVCYFNGHRHAC